MHALLYQSLFVQGRGALRKELTAYVRKARKAQERAGRIAGALGDADDALAFSERPAERQDRAVPGHWEADLLLGRGGRSQVLTLVERDSRFVMLTALSHGGGTAAEIREALAAKIKMLPDELQNALAPSADKRKQEPVVFGLHTELKVYFCDPAKPWRTGSNESTHGLLRQFLPESSDRKPRRTGRTGPLCRAHERPAARDAQLDVSL